MEKGKVWLVGAGPSDPGLFTLKGKAVLDRAEVVVYDRLVGRGILAMIPAGAEKIDVGKRSGNHPVPQEEINAILLQKALEGRRVVRLKGGDPFVFGRGGEELELLKANHIPFEVVPGITSAVSVPAYAGIPVTHRDFCSSVHIITAHRKRGSKEAVDFASLAKLEGTLIFLMGVSAMGDICQGLMKAGMNKDTPAAVLEKGTTAGQRRVISTLEHLKRDADGEQIGTPAIIVVGKVCALADEFHWAEDRKLGNRRIIVTRPKDRSSSLAEKLKELGAEVVLLPSIETKRIIPNAALSQAVEEIGDYRWIVFTSTAGVKAFFDYLREIRMDVRKLAGINFAAIGPATKKAIEEKGILVHLIPDKYTGDELGRKLAAVVGAGEKLLILRAAIATDNLLIPLDEAKISYRDIPVYDTLAAGCEEIELEDSDLVTFTSASTVGGFVQNMKHIDFSRVNAICIGEETAKKAAEYGMNIYVARQASIDSMIELILSL